MNNGPTTSGERAPSRLRADEPTLARYAGGIGWGLVVVGIVGVGANFYYATPRLLIPSSGFGWFLVLVGLILAHIHAAVETDLLLRRVLGGIGAGLAIIGVIIGAVACLVEPGKSKFVDAMGHSWAIGLVPAIPGIFLIALYIRSEEDEATRAKALLGFGVVGLLLAVGGVALTMAFPLLMPARWSVMMALGVILVLIYLGFAGVSDVWARRAACALGCVGGVGIVWALYVSCLHAWIEPPQNNEHLIGLPFGISLVVLGLAAYFTLGKRPDQANAAQIRRLAIFATVVGGMVTFLSLTRYQWPNIVTQMGSRDAFSRPYLMPTGLVLIAAGLIYVAIGVGFVSENRLVVLTRRELSAYFVSPIAYFVMLGFIVIAVCSYFLFLSGVLLMAERQQMMEEPIVQNYVIAFLPVVAVMLSVPLLTMGLFAEERRTGTMEVLLTAPVNDWLIVLSKFFASWFFFMLLWLPWWLFLLALRLEGGKEFDFRPMIGFSLALLACGAAFTSMGIFFSSLTRSQIVSAALTFMGMMVLVGFFFVERVLRGAGNLEVSVKAVMRALSFVHMWIDATDGKLYMRDVIVELSLAIFWLFATVKVLEARRWS
jgi:ABC-2 type transport system permease protein